MTLHKGGHIYIQDGENSMESLALGNIYSWEEGERGKPENTITKKKKQLGKLGEYKEFQESQLKKKCCREAKRVKD